MLINIIEIKHIRNVEKINPVEVKELKVYFDIDEPKNDSLQSNLNVKWEIECLPLDQKLCEYHIIYTKSESRRDHEPEVMIKEFSADKSEEYQATLTKQNTGIYNHFFMTFKSGELSLGTSFKINVNLKDYYRFMWNDCETFLVNTNLFGNSVNKLEIILNFKSNKISNTNITIYDVNPINFKRTKIQYLSHSKISENEHIFSFSTNSKIKNKVFLIVIPKCK